MSEAKQVLFVAFDGFQLLDLVGPMDIFHGANELLRQKKRNTRDYYRISVATLDGKDVRASNGLRVASEGSIGAVLPKIDTLIIPGALSIESRIAANPAIPDFIKKVAPKTRRVVSVCSGAFFVAEAGLLDRKRVTTHWAGAELLKRRYPKARVESDQIYIRDGRIYTSGGVTAGMDLALALVEEDLGSEVALDLARWLVLYLRRPGGQAQFSAPLKAQFSGSPLVKKIMDWILDHPSEDLSVDTLARRSGVSPRTFARLFLKETGGTPAKFIHQTRLERACRELVDSDAGLKTVAQRSGFGTEESLRRAFQKKFRVAPGEYRERFRVGLPYSPGE